MKVNIKKLVISIAIPLLIGGISALVSGGGMAAFGELNKPPLSPPGILFPIVWTILYVLMGISSYLVFTSEEDDTIKLSALLPYFLQLFFNFFWSIFFFKQEWFYFSFIWLVVLWLLIIWNIIAFYQVNKKAANLLIPYLLWVTFAGYLNLAIAILN